jgi:hypothetical protein
MDFENLSEVQQAQIDFFREQAALVKPPEISEGLATVNDWWWCDMVVAFSGGPKGSHWTVVIRDLGGQHTQVRGQSTNGSAGVPVASLGFYTGFVRNMHQLQGQKGTWSFAGTNGLGGGSMFLEDSRSIHWQPLVFTGFVPPSFFQGHLQFGNVHPRP